MKANRIAVEQGAMVLTYDGTAVVVHVDVQGVELRDVRGQVEWVPWPDVTMMQSLDPAVGEVPALHSFAAEWERLDDGAREEALFRLGIVQEIVTGFRHGHADLALPGEPNATFDPASGFSLTARCERMAKLLRHEALTGRAGGFDVTQVSGRTLYKWVKAAEEGGLLGLVDQRRARTTEVFSTIPLAWRQAAHEVVADFDGDVSTVNLREVHRRIKVRLHEAGHSIVAPQRASGRFVAHLMRTRGATTRAQRSNKLRGVAGTQSYAAMVPGQIVAIDVTRFDAMVWCPVRGGACSVEVISAMDVATRVILALRVVPLSANSHDASLLMYDAMRPFSQVVEGTSVSDWAWAGVPERIEFYSDASGAEPDCSGVEVTCPRTCRSLRIAPGMQGEHLVPGVRPAAVRSDHGSIFLSPVFRHLLDRCGIDHPRSRRSHPIDNGILERYHETLQRAAQQLPGYKGRNVSERGRTVGLGGADDAITLLTAPELEKFLRRWIVFDYHRQPHDGLQLPGTHRTGVRPIDMFDALLKVTGRLHVPQRPDLLYDFLPTRWATVGHSGVELSGLTYDSPELEGLRSAPKGTFRAEDRAMPFHYDPHDVNRIWFRHPDTGRIVEVPWRKAHLIDAPMTETLVQHVRAAVQQRGSGPRPSRTAVEDEIITELGNLLKSVPKEWKKRISTATMRHEAAQRDHAEADVARTVAEIATPEAAVNPAPGDRNPESHPMWADSWSYTPPEAEAG
ncbi:Mu transposase C-terminal domain-containing protein [Isoptericola croceus]|uniref:Mu transposase C-terminal domain-containing protein n=1 Tax=Isoptericola croceus TaxID=3031406 RepID=UPI0023F6ED6D|nr:Mu transposase C-terminal domain-containing protein [Isoptericola croceus]